MPMIYDKLNDTLHALPCRIRGLAVSTPNSADDAFLARANLRWATAEEVAAYEASQVPPTLEERLAPIMGDLQMLLTALQAFGITNLPETWAETQQQINATEMDQGTKFELYVLWKERLQPYEAEIREYLNA